MTKLLKMLKPLEEAGGSSKTMTTIEQMKINTMARIYEMCFDAGRAEARGVRGDS